MNTTNQIDYTSVSGNTDNCSGSTTFTVPWEITYHGWPYFYWPQPYEWNCKKSTKLTVEGEIDSIIDLIKNVEGRVKITIESV